MPNVTGIGEPIGDREQRSLEKDNEQPSCLEKTILNVTKRKAFHCTQFSESRSFSMLSTHFLPLYVGALPIAYLLLLSSSCPKVVKSNLRLA